MRALQIIKPKDHDFLIDYTFKILTFLDENYVGFLFFKNILSVRIVFLYIRDIQKHKMLPKISSNYILDCFQLVHKNED